MIERARRLERTRYQIVTIGEDFTIQYDQSWPGINQLACPACK